MTERELIKLFKKAKVARDQAYTTNPEALELVHKMVRQRIDQSGIMPVAISKPWSKPVFLLGFLRYITPPSFAYGMAAFVIFAVSVAGAIAARSALPGQSLYSTKIALEQTHARFVSNPSERAKVQMEFAGRRLEEVRAVTASPEQEGATLKRFSKEVKQAKDTLKEAADPLQVEAASAEITKKARQYQEELLKSKNTKSERTVDVAAYEEASNALKEVTGEKGAE